MTTYPFSKLVGLHSSSYKAEKHHPLALLDPNPNSTCIIIWSKLVSMVDDRPQTERNGVLRHQFLSLHSWDKQISAIWVKLAHPTEVLPHGYDGAEQHLITNAVHSHEETGS